MATRHAVVTGAFSNTGSAVAAELIRRGWSVGTLTNHPAPQPGPITVAPLEFEPEALRQSLAGADTLVNTYWVRYPRRGMTFEIAARHSRMLLDAAKTAGVRRFVQVSVCNASEDSTLGYYRWKARVDAQVQGSGLSWAIVRPTLIVGPKDILTNNIAWFLRRFPLFALPAGPGYRLQPILREEVARVIADTVEDARSFTVDAAGPDILTFSEYVKGVAGALGLRRAFVALPPAAVLGALSGFSTLLRDVVLTAEELEGLRQNRLVSHQPPLGTASVLDWIGAHATGFGHRYANDSRSAPA